MEQKFRLVWFFFLTVAFSFLFFSCNVQKAQNESTQVSDPVDIDPFNPSPPGRVMAFPDTIFYTHPDGYVLEIFLVGDERYHYAKTTDQYFLLINEDGFYEYAYRDRSGNLKSIGLIAKNKEDREEKEIRLLENITKAED